MNGNEKKEKLNEKEMDKISGGATVFNSQVYKWYNQNLNAIIGRIKLIVGDTKKSCDILYSIQCYIHDERPSVLEMDEILSKMSNEEKKKKIKEEDLNTISGGCGSSIPKAKYKVGQRITVCLRDNGWRDGTIIEIVPGSTCYLYIINFDKKVKWYEKSPLDLENLTPPVDRMRLI